MTFGEELRETRTKVLDWTQAKVAVLFKCDVASIRNYERGRSEPPYLSQVGARALLAEAAAKKAQEGT